MRHSFPLLFTSLAAVLFLAACPLSAGAVIVCPAAPGTFAEEMAEMDAAVIVTLRELPGDPGPEIPGLEPEPPKAKFEIDRVLKGGLLAEPAQRIEAHFFGEGKPGHRFLLMGANEPPLAWNSPVPITVRSEAYLSQLGKLPEDAKTRMHFFYSFLRDADELLARDAFEELNKFDYEQLVKFKGELDHDRLVAGIKDKETPTSHRRLFLRMLSICGTQEDVPLLEGIVQSKDKSEKRGLDAAIACYLTLRGTDGLALVEERFLRNKGADYADTYCAIMALRESEGNVIPQHRRLEALRLMLDRPDLTDIVIPDLARMDDWDQVDRLFAMFKADVAADAEGKSWLRVPVINYLRACPLSKARKLLEECGRLDPKSMERAIKFQPDVTPKPLKFAA